MEQQDCFGSLKEISSDSETSTQAKPECRKCVQIRDCLRRSKEIAEEEIDRLELRKQNLITQTIDYSVILTNELGACLLEFLSRLYSSPLGAFLFKNLFLFYEIPQKSSSFHLTIPISQGMIDLIHDEKEKPGVSPFSKDAHSPKTSEEEFVLRIILLQKSFPNHLKANMGMIAHEVARALASDKLSIKQILQILPDTEVDLFQKMTVGNRAKWLVEKWGFANEFEALKEAMAAERS